MDTEWINAANRLRETGSPHGRKGIAMEETNENGVTFKTWYRQCDQVCSSIAGLGIEDLADGPSWDCWDAGYSPRQYVLERLEDEGFPMEVL